MQSSTYPMLKDGIPDQADYQALIKSSLFQEMSHYSEQFIENQSEILKGYSRKWNANPLYQWSRQWEYPYVFQQIIQLAQSGKQLKVLDAGSGVTFFPWYLQQQLDVSVSCCDYDQALTPVYQHLAQALSPVEFSAEDLRTLSYPDNSFDVIYCVSVLEHTGDYKKIIEGFKRILKPGGQLIITFDVSLNGSRDISPLMAEKLLGYLFEQSTSTTDLITGFTDQLKNEAILTTHFAQDIDSSLLPWPHPKWAYQLNHLLQKRRWIEWPPVLTICCCTIAWNTAENDRSEDEAEAADTLLLQ